MKWKMIASTNREETSLASSRKKGKRGRDLITRVSSLPLRKGVLMICLKRHKKLKLLKLIVNLKTSEESYN